MPKEFDRPRLFDEIISQLLLENNVPDVYKRVFISFFSLCLFPVLDRLFRTPVKAGEALLAGVRPAGLVVANRHCCARAHPGADSASVTGILDAEVP
jgi:hypothetical protein